MSALKTRADRTNHTKTDGYPKPKVLRNFEKLVEPDSIRMANVFQRWEPTKSADEIVCIPTGEMPIETMDMILVAIRNLTLQLPDEAHAAAMEVLNGFPGPVLQKLIESDSSQLETIAKFVLDHSKGSSRTNMAKILAIVAEMESTNDTVKNTIEKLAHQTLAGDENAAECLIIIGDKRAEEILITNPIIGVGSELETLRDGWHGKVRGIVMALSTCGTEKSIQILMGMLRAYRTIYVAIETQEGENREMIFTTLIYALGRLRANEAMPILIETVNDRATSKERDSTVPEEDAPSTPLATAIRALGKLGGIEIARALLFTEGLIRDKEDEQPQIGHTTIDRLVENTLREIGLDAIPVLIEALDHKYDTVRKMAVRVLASLGSQEPVDALIRNLDPIIYCSAFSPGETAGRATIETVIFALGELKATKASKPLAKMLKTVDPEKHDTAVALISALSKIGDETAINALINYMTRYAGEVEEIIRYAIAYNALETIINECNDIETLDAMQRIIEEIEKGILLRVKKWLLNFTAKGRWWILLREEQPAKLSMMIQTRRQILTPNGGPYGK
ncbi:hypothetical protein KKF81_00840 [Candidatus Micrarchaeota archaeon]|nr:hypothetical protein [Candidatus Micrarchaeota archaeon]